MSKLWVLAGTTEGRELVRFLTELAVPAIATVATAYGQEVLLAEEPPACVRTGPLLREDMTRLLQREQIGLTIDATHPYAAEASANARAACQAANVPYWRLRRPEGGSVSGAYYAADLAGAVRFLSTTTGPILAAIGAKGLAQLQALPDYQKRLYVRVLPMVQSLTLCQELGLAGKHILAMQGPFSAAFNQALLQEVGAQWLLTKDSGDSGGFAQKVQAAQALGVGLVIIRRPADEAGYTLAEIKAMLMEREKGEGIWPSSI